MYNIIIPRKPTELALRKLYLVDKLSVDEIADIYEYKTINSIKRALKRFKIPIRTRKENCMLIYGVEHPSQTKEFQEKKVKTMLERYGVEHAFQVKEFQEKVKQTMVERYGVENPSQAEEFKEKKKQTNLEKRGVEHNFQCEENKEKRKQTCKEKYGVEHPMQSKEVQEKMELTCLKNLGVKNPSQVHIKNYEIWNNEKLFQEWIMETYNKLGRKLRTGDLNNYFNLTQSDTSTIKLRGLPEEYNKYYKLNTSYLEPVVEDWIKKNTTSVYEKNKYYDFMRNTNDNRMQLDFFFPELKIAIEVNDNWSHTLEFKIERRGMSLEEAQNYEQIKSDLCKANGIKLIHLWEDDIGDIDNILGNIKDK